MQLSALPVTGIKMDIELLRSARRWDKSRRIYAAVTELGRQLGLSVTAEGVETSDDACFVRSHGVDFVQGFHVARKLALQDLLGRLRSLAPASSPTVR